VNRRLRLSAVVAARALAFDLGPIGLLESAGKLVGVLGERPRWWLAFPAVLAHGRWTLDVVNTNVSGVE
jgi:hypothetical protein